MPRKKPLPAPGEPQPYDGETEPGYGDDAPITLDKRRIQREKLDERVWRYISWGESSVLERRDALIAWRDQYECIPPARDPDIGPWEDSADVHTVTTRAHLNTVHARAIHVINGVSPFMKLQAFRRDEQEVARDLEDYLDYILTYQVNWPVVMDEAVHVALRDGTAILKPYWKKETRATKVPRTVDEDFLSEMEATPELDEQGSPTGRHALPDNTMVTEGDTVHVIHEETVADHPAIKVIPLENFVMYPAESLSVDDAALVADRIYKTLDDLKRGARDGFYDKQAVDYLLESPPSAVLRGGRQGQDDERLVEEGIQPQSTDIYNHGLIELWEGVVRFDADGDGYEEDVCFLFEPQRRVFLRAQIWPYWFAERNYIPMRPFPRFGRFYGYAIPEILESIQLQDNAVTNQGLDAGTLALSPIIKQKRTSRTDLSATKLQLGKIHFVDAMDDFAIEGFAPPRQDNFMDMQNIRAMAERLTGASDATMGVQPSKSRTLGETETLLQEGNLNFDVMIQRLQMGTNQPLAQIVLALARQFMPGDQEILIAGKPLPDFKLITREMLRAKIGITAHANTLNTNRDLEMQGAEKLVMLSERSPFMQADPVRLWSVQARFLDAYGIKDYETYLGTKEDAEKMKDQPAGPPPLQISARLDPAASLAVFLAENPQIAQAVLPLLSRLNAEGNQAQMMESQAKVQTDQAKLGLEAQKHQMEMAHEQQKGQHEIALEQAKAQHQMGLEQMKTHAQVQNQAITTAAQAEAIRRKGTMTPSGNGDAGAKTRGAGGGKSSA